MQLFDPRLMKLLTFLTRRQAWLAPNEVSRDFKPKNMTAEIHDLTGAFSDAPTFRAVGGRMILLDCGSEHPDARDRDSDSTRP